MSKLSAESHICCGLLFYGQKMKNKWIFFVYIQKKHVFFFIFVEKIDLKNGDVEVMPLGKKKTINFYHFNFS